jgi:uncharacterized membrane protein YjfL (UPF0719 family)
MAIGSLVSTLIYLLAAILLFVAGKWFYDFTRPRFTLVEELVRRHNVALSLSLGGYFLGLTMALGGVLVGPSHGSLGQSLRDILIYGVLAIALLNLSSLINDWLSLPGVSQEKEILQDQNWGVGLMEGANHAAVGLLLFGVLSGEGGGLMALLVFWLLGQALLIAAAKIYDWITPGRLIPVIAQGNAAAAIALAGMIVGLGNVMRVAVQGNFVSWSNSLLSFAVVAIFGLCSLPLIRLATSWLIFPGQSLTKELFHPDSPNLSAGVIEGIIYVCVSLLIGWSI